MRAVQGSAGFRRPIKLAKTGALEVVIKVWSCLIPQAVSAETIERRIRPGYPDAPAIREALSPSVVRSRVRHPRATTLVEKKRGWGRGEREALHLFFTAQADAVISDDAAFVTVLVEAGLPHLLPPLVLVQLSPEGQLESRAALRGLMQTHVLLIRGCPRSPEGRGDG